MFAEALRVGMYCKCEGMAWMMERIYNVGMDALGSVSADGVWDDALAGWASLPSQSGLSLGTGPRGYSYWYLYRLGKHGHQNRNPARQKYCTHVDVPPTGE